MIDIDAAAAAANTPLVAPLLLAVVVAALLQKPIVWLARLYQISQEFVRIFLVLLTESFLIMLRQREHLGSIRAQQPLLHNIFKSKNHINIIIG